MPAGESPRDALAGALERGGDGIAVSPRNRIATRAPCPMKSGFEYCLGFLYGAVWASQHRVAETVNRDDVVAGLLGPGGLLWEEGVTRRPPLGAGPLPRRSPPGLAGTRVPAPPTSTRHTPEPSISTHHVRVSFHLVCICKGDETTLVKERIECQCFQVWNSMTHSKRLLTGGL